MKQLGGLLSISLSLLILTSVGQAQEFVYTPRNPTFGGNAFNSAHLLGLANAQNQHKERPNSAQLGAGSLSESDRFMQMLQSRLYSGLADRVSEAIFGESAQANGTVKFQEQEISWITTGSEIRLTVTNLSTGEISEIVVPTLIQ